MDSAPSKSLLNAKQRLITFRNKASAGGISKFGLFQPKYQPGEELWARIPQKAVRKMSVDATQADIDSNNFLDDAGQLKNQGAMYVTNLRLLLIGNGGKIIQEWRWDSLAAVRVFRGFGGVKLIAQEGDTTCDCLLHVYNKKFFLDTRPEVVAVQCLKIEAAWVLATGQNFDNWLADLDRRSQE